MQNTRARPAETATGGGRLQIPEGEAEDGGALPDPNPSRPPPTRLARGGGRPGGGEAEVTNVISSQRGHVESRAPSAKRGPAAAGPGGSPSPEGWADGGLAIGAAVDGGGCRLQPAEERGGGPGQGRGP